MFSVGKQVGAADACSLSLARLASNTCTAREPCKQYSWGLQAILGRFAGNTRGLCGQNLAALLAICGGIACCLAGHCLLRRLTMDVTRLKWMVRNEKCYFVGERWIRGLH